MKKDIGEHIISKLDLPDIVKILSDELSLSLIHISVRVVKSMPKWLPGKQNGKAVRVKFTVPVMFRLQ